MKIWKMECRWRKKREWDIYDGLVVAADTREEALSIHPREQDKGTYFDPWVDADQIKITLLGQATADIKKGIILESFVAG